MNLRKKIKFLGPRRIFPKKSFVSHIGCWPLPESSPEFPVEEEQIKVINVFYFLIVYMLLLNTGFYPSIQF